MNEIRFIDLFSGIGGFRQGLESIEGFRCVWSNDFNKYASQILNGGYGRQMNIRNTETLGIKTLHDCRIQQEVRNNE